MLHSLLGSPTILFMDEFANKTIDALGGTSAVAEMCDIKPPSVSEWRRAGIPKPWIKYFGCIRPDLFPDAPVACKSNKAA